MLRPGATPRLLAFTLAAAGSFNATGDAHAMPMFARKYHVDCSACHDAPTVPRLNDFGFKFRRAGYRLPEEIGQEQMNEFRWTDYASARAEINFTEAYTYDTTVNPSVSNSTSAFEATEAGLFLLTGSFGRYWGSTVEATLATGESPELEKMYLRGAFGDALRWFQFRVGAFHPWEGFGGSDEPIGVTRPLFETTTANNNQDTLAPLWGPNRAGAEIGVQWHNTSISALALNRLTTTVQDGQLVSNGLPPDGSIRKDVMVIAHQILGRRTGVSLLWLYGSNPLPTDPAAFAAGTGSNVWREHYHRLAAFASVGIHRYMLLGGAGFGFDRSRDTATGNTSGFRSGGGFLELDVALPRLSAAFLRLDYFDPSFSVAHNQQAAITAGGTVFATWFLIVPELQTLRTSGSPGSRFDLVGVLHALVIY